MEGRKQKTPKNTVGARYGRLTPDSKYIGKPAYANDKIPCICDCGNKRFVKFNNLRRGLSKSCGCYHSERVSKARKAYIDLNIPKTGDRVRRIDTGEEYASRAEAARLNEISANGILYAIKHCKPCKGIWFEFIDSPLPLPDE